MALAKLSGTCTSEPLDNLYLAFIDHPDPEISNKRVPHDLESLRNEAVEFLQANMKAQLQMQMSPAYNLGKAPWHSVTQVPELSKLPDLCKYALVVFHLSASARDGWSTLCDALSTPLTSSQVQHEQHQLRGSARAWLYILNNC
jgi:hypothetical protein